MYRDAAMALPNTIALTDGGVYENLGTEMLTKATSLPGGTVMGRAEFLLVSDGGYPARHEFELRRLPGVASLALLRCVNTNRARTGVRSTSPAADSDVRTPTA